MARAGMVTAWQAAGRRLAERMADHRTGRIGLHAAALLFDRELRWHAAGIVRELSRLRGRAFANDGT